MLQERVYLKQLCTAQHFLLLPDKRLVFHTDATPHLTWPIMVMVSCGLICHTSVVARVHCRDRPAPNRWRSFGSRSWSTSQPQPLQRHTVRKPPGPYGWCPWKMAVRRQTHTGGHHVMMKTGTGAVQLRAKEHEGWEQEGRRPPADFRVSSLPMPWLQTPASTAARQEVSVALSHLVCGTLFSSPRKLRVSRNMGTFKARLWPSF